MRNRFFKHDPGYIALKDLEAKTSKYSATTTSRERSSSNSTDNSDDCYTSSFKKRMSTAFSSRTSRHSRKSSVVSDIIKSKRASFRGAFTATKDVLVSIPLTTRRSTDCSTDGRGEQKTATDKIAGKERHSWIKNWASSPPIELGPVFTVSHSTLFTPF
ncbi:hypothetical protein NQ176_g2689 [Zarea fungicola]|uniref:Uncharacterized protein n=1 Tax=Zarea fungicola TaxID=93591 RepID=A0ACC1NMS6_9HYPO|nr:hypothetical protein NQ176_g2689 [Lecanicillium fungicola]